MPVRMAMHQERVAQCFEGARLVPAEVVRNDEIQNRASLGFVSQPDVLDAISPCASRCLALHGDRHRGWTGRSGDVVACSAPSLTLGTRGGKVSWKFLHPRIFHRRRGTYSADDN